MSGPAGLRLVHRPQQHGQRPVHGGVVPGALPDRRPGPVQLARPARQPSARPQHQHVPQRGQVQLVLHPLPRSGPRARGWGWGVDPPGCGRSHAHLGLCPSACQCNGHSRCVNESVCEKCENLTSGRHCESCISGFYGDPTNGGSCQREYRRRSSLSMLTDADVSKEGWRSFQTSSIIPLFVVYHFYFCFCFSLWLQPANATATPACATPTTANASAPPKASKGTAVTCECPHVPPHQRLSSGLTFAPSGLLP